MFTICTKNIDWMLVCQQTFALKSPHLFNTLLSYNSVFIPKMRGVYDLNQFSWKIVWCNENWHGFGARLTRITACCAMLSHFSCVWLCDPMDCSLPSSSVHGIFQARILEWVAISFSRRSSQPRNWTQVSHIVGRCFTVWATRASIYILPMSVFMPSWIVTDWPTKPKTFVLRS